MKQKVTKLVTPPFSANQNNAKLETRKKCPNSHTILRSADCSVSCEVRLKTLKHIGSL